ncbi:Glyoxylase, beta-lactamase superfamily II [Cognatiyoonia sediminum]|uniref:Glyoxylase, beta-lactamase superfamily II n=1 Tax=Cognatiyoonia sediminum TaxID=1508389 RepID=A0A1M5MD03_9RHOB|nr:MBL fold metallo-hydrolase [Cognatiyoonia sediminum]SHG75135.1 Glyoxylase, beta-lactamase superfamily II [Cognatiyoonia sediminum]
MEQESFDPPIGVGEEIAPGLRRIVAPNPSPMTFRGTNTYILGTANLAIIDPGPDSPDHLDAILSTIGDAKVQLIFVTHSHLDHSPLASKLADQTHAPVLAFGDSSSGRSEIMTSLAAAGFVGGGEGVDLWFVPDREVVDGEMFFSAEWVLKVIHSPGHMGNHISLRWNDAIFTGDLVMGWASSLVSPPDGDLSDFMDSCERLLSEKPKSLFPGHGAPVSAAMERIEWLLEHRRGRTNDILAALADGNKTVEQLTAEIYSDTPAALHPAAARNLFAHLIDLSKRGEVFAQPTLRPDALFRRTI